MSRLGNGEARELPECGWGKSDGDCGKETGLAPGGLWACPVDPDESVSDGAGWARRCRQTPWYPMGMCRARWKFLVRGGRLDDSVVAEPQAGITDRLWLAWCAP